MFSNFLRIAYRNLLRHPRYSIINIGGLSIGIGACMIILLFVVHEHSYDKFHKDASQIYSIYGKIKIGGDTLQFSGMSYATAPAMQQADPSVLSALRLENINEKKTVLNPLVPGKAFGESAFVFADPNFYRFFSFRLKRGDPEKVLSRPFTVVITEEIAKKYFGDADPIGKLLRYDSAWTFEVTGITEKAPSNSTLQFDLIGSMASRPLMKKAAASAAVPEDASVVVFGSYTTLLQLKDGTQPARVEKTLLNLAKQSKDFSELPSRYFLKSLTETHLEINFYDDGNSRYLSVFALVAGLILLLALINYMNLSTARATLRAREVGVRKAIGASRFRIAQQFYVESALYALIAFALGFLLFRLTQPYFYNLIHLKIDPNFLYQPTVLLVFGGLLLVTILIAGTYPSIILSAFNPVVVLYGRLRGGQGGASLRKVLTTLQFTASIVLIISSVLIERQLYFFRHTDTGINREQVMTIPLAGTTQRHAQAFEEEVRQLPGISGAALTRYALYHGFDMFQASAHDGEKDVSFRAFTVDDQFIPLLGIQWQSEPGKRSVYWEDRQVVLNQAAVDKIHLTGNPVGQQITLNGGKISIAGVVKNFNFSSLQFKVDALCMLVYKDKLKVGSSSQPGCLVTRFRAGTNLPATIEAIKKIYAHYDINTPFEFEFMDEAFNAGYRAEEKLAGILAVFTGLTILIACMGLFGLAAFSATQKTKEIGIRKTLGASVQSIILLLTKDFIRLVVLANLVAIPLAWWLMHSWLKNFAYKISIGWGVFVVSGLSAIGIALFTVSFEAFRSARANPVKSLKAE